MQILSVLLLLVIATAHGATSDEDIQLSKPFGGSGGVAFSDIELVEFGQTASSITISAKKRVTAVVLRVATPAELTLSHGKSRGTDHTLILADDEFVQTMEVHWARKAFTSRVFFLRFTTNRNNSVSAGTPTEDGATVAAPNGFQLSGFFGRAEGEVDQLGAIWSRINASTKALNDTMGSAWYGDQIRNWVGPAVVTAGDSACYRKTEPFGSNKTCPLGYSEHGFNCIAQCPVSYPVDCYEECIPQNDDCTGEVLSKAASVVGAAFSTMTAGIVGAIFSSYQNGKKHFMCAANIIGVIKSLIYYLRFQRTMSPQGSLEEMLAVAYQSDVVVFALPVAVANCLGEEVSGKVKFASIVYVIVENIVKQVITNGDQVLSSATNVLALLSNTSTIESTDDSTVEELQDLLNSNSTCGYQLKNLTDHVITSVREIRNTTPRASVNDVRVKISQSSLVQKDIPTATNNCMHELLGNKTKQTAFETRDLIRKTIGVIVDQLIETNKTDMGSSVAENDYMLGAANLALVVLGGMDPTGIAWMVSQFVQPTCGPTSFIGEIDDGTLYDALGLKTIDEAFKGSYGTWSKQGDGMMDVSFESTDSKDVTVVIHSGGEEYEKVEVPAGTTVKWTVKISELHDKAFYLDRWRTSVVGIPMTAGGSLVLWVPRSSQGGHLCLHVRINVS